MKRLLSLLAVLILVSGCAGLGRGGAGGSALIGPDGKPITPGTAADFVARAKDRVFFELDKYDLSAEAVEGLKAQVAWLAQYKDKNIVIEGHCDERGTREYNLALGERRARAVKNFLVSQGVAPSRVKTISYGKERPAVSGSNEAAWAQNRRGVTVVVE